MAPSKHAKGDEHAEGALFPIHANEHGIEMTVVKVDLGKRSQEFKIHKSLLVKTSPYFARALTGEFKEATESVICLKEHDPIAFSVLYQYIYTGNVHAADFYSKGTIPDDLLWLRTFNISDATMVHPLLHIAYDRLRSEFSGTTRHVPSFSFISELFNAEYPQQDLEDYVAAHSAHWILSRSCGHWKDWVVLMDAVPHYGVAVAKQMTKRQSPEYRASKDHPTDDPHFDKDTLFPVPIPTLAAPEEVEEEDTKKGDGEAASAKVE